MRLTLRAFELWMQSEFTWTKPVQFAVGRMPDTPDRAAYIVRQSNPRIVMNGTFEELIYRIQTRGLSGKHLDAEQFANAVDEFLDGRTNFDIGECYVTSCSTYSGPRMLTMTDPQSRFQFTADYKLIAER